MISMKVHNCKGVNCPKGRVHIQIVFGLYISSVTSSLSQQFSYRWYQVLFCQASRLDDKVTLHAFVWLFSTVWEQINLQKSCTEDIWAHWLSFFTFLHCVMLNELSKCLHKKMLGYNKCIWLAFLHCAFSNVSSSCLPETMQSHTGCICLTCIHSVLSHRLWKRLHFFSYHLEIQLQMFIYFLKTFLGTHELAWVSWFFLCDISTSFLSN